MTAAELKPITLEVLQNMEGASERWIVQRDIELAVSKVLVERGLLQTGCVLYAGALQQTLKQLKAEGQVKFWSTIRFNGRSCTGADHWRLVPLNQTATAI